MNKSLSARIMDLLQRRQLKGTLAKIALTISCVAIFLITYLLVAPVLTQEWETVCGMEEHVHTEECYTLVPADSAEAAEPTGAVKPAEPAEPAQGGHHHTDECYEEVPAEPGEGGHHHTDECYEEVIVEPAVEGHSHTSDCYEESSSLSCGMSEHSHSDGCLDEEGNQVCGMDEHSHSDSCYETSSELVCGQEETEGREAKTERQLICGQEETDGQEPATERRLVCGMEETDGAEETTGETAEEPAGEDEAEETGEADAEGQEPEMIRVLTCGKEEHVHSDQCYQKHEISGPEYICGFLTEHAHDDSCYFESGELKCTIPEHTHDDSCLTPQVTVSQVSGIFPEKLPEGYIEIPSMDESAAFAIDEAGQPVPQGVKAQIYAPENAFEEGQEIVFVSQPLDEQTEEYDEFASALAEEQGDEENYNNLTAMDLGFYNENGDEVEPNTENGPVYVRLTIPMELAEEPDFDLWHYNDAESQEDPENVLEQMDVDFNYENGVLTVDFAADSFSPFMLRMKAKATPEQPIQWSGALKSKEATWEDENGVRIWDAYTDVTTRHRYVELPISINVSKGNQVTLPLVVSGVTRDENILPELEFEAIPKTWNPKTNDGTETITIIAPDDVSHLDVYYKFDCWNVVSDRKFTIECSVGAQHGTATTYPLQGQIHTGYDFEFLEYDNSVGNSDYAFDGFGGADKQTAYIDHWNKAYEIYFGLTEQVFNSTKATVKETWPNGKQLLAFDSGKYVYDIAPFVISPKGQQPYDINVTFTPKQGGELVGAVYMMDSKNPESMVKLNQVASSNRGYNFTISNDQLNGKIVSGDLAEQTDSKTYVLYFLVKYPTDELKKVYPDDADHTTMKLEASLSLTHSGIDSEISTSPKEKMATPYEGTKKPVDRIYWASYYAGNVESKTGLSSLKNGATATLEYAADFFALNQARTGEQIDPSGEYRLEAIIDLSYLSDYSTQKYDLLNDGDYRFSAFNLSLIDASGNWSQNSHGVPNVGWTDFSVPEWAAKEQIEIWGSTSLTGNTWEPISTVLASSVWVKDKDRAFTGDYQLISSEKNYVRLKVVYNSRLTTGLRVGYRMELQPQLLTNHGLENAESLNLTSWFNYIAYRGTAADAAKADLKFSKYPTCDHPEGKPDLGTISLARENYDYQNLGSYLGYNITDADKNEWSLAYSLRNSAKATLGSNTEVAGMVVSQILYDSQEKVVGAKERMDSWNPKSSYSRQKEVVNTSEIVYSISGIVTNRANSLKDLQEHMKEAPDGSPYKAVKQKYYVLLPEGLELNTNPKGSHEGTASPEPDPSWYYLSGYSWFYKDQDPKGVDTINGCAQQNVPVSDVNVPTLNKNRKDGLTADMQWFNGEQYVSWVDWNREEKRMVNGRQLLVFERTLPDYMSEDAARYNLWGGDDERTFFWGRGLSFSVVPVGGTGHLPANTYVTDFWCQYLDANGNPIALDGFDKNSGVEKVPTEPLAGLVDETQKDTLLYIPITFTNTSGHGGSNAEITVKNDKDEDSAYSNSANVDPEDEYSYRLEYSVKEGSSTQDVVLWCNVEDKKADWRGTVTGVDLNGHNAQVFVRRKTSDSDNFFNTTDYITKADPKLLTAENGWEKVTDLTGANWADVQSIAFWFNDKKFESEGSASVLIKMKAPKEDEIDKKVEKVAYVTYNEFIASDKHIGQNDVLTAGHILKGPTEVILTVKYPLGYILPSTGGAGSATMCATGMALILAAMGLMYLTLRRSRKQREGGNV